MRIIDTLISEHVLIRFFLDILEEGVSRMEQGAVLSRAFLERTVRFARGFADKQHHYKEEDLLFEQLGRKMHGAIDAHIEFLSDQHEQGRQYVSEIHLGIEDYERNLKGARDSVRRSITGYLELLHVHIHQEDHKFFPLVQQLFSDEEDLDFISRFSNLEESMRGIPLEEAQRLVLAMEADLSEDEAPNPFDRQGAGGSHKVMSNAWKAENPYYFALEEDPIKE